MPSEITVQQFQKVVPKSLKRSITPALVEKINSTISSPETVETFKENLLSYAHVMKEGRFKMHSYINAVKYVSSKMLGSSNIAAYVKTFPDTYTRLVEEGASEKDISAYVAAYNKTKLVNLIYEQTFIPTYVLNAHMFQDALNTQAELMLHARSEKVRSDAANSILTHLKRPEVQKLEIDIGVKEDDSIQALRISTMELVKQQRKMIENGHCSATAIAASSIIDITPEPEVEVPDAD